MKLQHLQNQKAEAYIVKFPEKVRGSAKDSEWMSAKRWFYVGFKKKKLF